MTFSLFFVNSSFLLGDTYIFKKDPHNIYLIYKYFIAFNNIYKFSNRQIIAQIIVYSNKCLIMETFHNKTINLINSIEIINNIYNI